MNPFIFSDINKRYHTYDYALRQKFGRKVCKIPVNAGFTCPNIDGTKGVGGCIYCTDAGSGEFAGDPSQGLATQFAQQKAQYDKWPQAGYIVYFQAHTNTYAPLEVLKNRYEQALSLPGVVGLNIATRADCLEEDVLDYLAALNARTALTVELGLQSVFDCTGERINRCHSYAQFLEGYQKLQARKIPVCIHLINGLPGEDRKMMVESARQVGKLRPQGVKLHLLHLLKGTALVHLFEAHAFTFLTKEEYVQIVCDQLELLPAQTVIHRLTGDGDKELLLGPMWSRDKRSVLNAIDMELARRDSMQGRYFDE